MNDDDTEGLRDKLARQGEDALGKFAQELLENPLVTGAISRAFDARDRASQAQEAALGALNIPSAADLERLTRRLRSVSQRLEGIEEALDRIDQRLEDIGRKLDTSGTVEDRLEELSTRLKTIADPAPIPREQERLEVDSPPARTRARKKSTSKSTSKSAPKSK